MIPPTSIDGTDITGATIDGTDVTEITVDGDTVFTAGPDIPVGGVSRWTFNNADISNNTLNDFWGSNDGTIEGMTTTTGIYPYDSGEAGNFDGVDDRVVFGQIPELSNVSEFSIAVWVNIDSGDPAPDILIGAYQDTDNAIRFTRSSDFLQVIVEKNGTRALAQGGTINTNTTQLCVMTYGNQTVKGYIGDTEVASGGGGPATTPTLDIFAGYNENQDQYIDGVLDEGRLYSKELTGTEVSNLNQTGSIN